MRRFLFSKRAAEEPMGESHPTRKFVFARSMAVVVAMSLSGFGVAARAAIIIYAPPALIGAQVIYPSVSESSETSTLPLYGAPTVSGNSLVFSNLSFAASSINGSPSLDFVDGQINFTLQADPGSFLQMLTLSEFGDYNVSTTPANPAAVDFVEAYQNPVLITVLAIDGVPVAPMENSSDIMSITDGGVFTNPPSSTPVSITAGWSGTVTADLMALFDSDQITEIAVSFDNELAAQSQPGGIADIAKKGFEVTPGEMSGGPGVPEPSVASLALVALGMGLKRRRNRQAAN
jgi:hypothetical protein